MLEHTLDRADRISEPEHKVTAVARNHRRCGLDRAIEVEGWED